MMLTRTTGDRCPAVLRLHEAADGSLARVRVPGGLLGVEGLTGLIWNTEALGDGHVEVTSRGNVQLRGLTDVDGLLVRSLLTKVGLHPHPGPVWAVAADTHACPVGACPPSRTGGPRSTDDPHP